MCVSVCGYALANAGVRIGWKGPSDPVELELEEVVSHLTWALGTKLQGSAGAGGAFDCCSLSPSL